MKYQALFSLQNNEKYSRLSSAATLTGIFRVHSLTTKKQTTKFSSANFQKMSKLCCMENSETRGQAV